MASLNEIVDKCCDIFRTDFRPQRRSEVTYGPMHIFRAKERVRLARKEVACAAETIDALPQRMKPSKRGSQSALFESWQRPFRSARQSRRKSC